MDRREFNELIKHGLIVSCQAEPEKGSQFYEPYDIGRMASEALSYGACAVRICGYRNVRETRSLNANATIIGITKHRYEDGRVLITESMGDIGQLVEAGADVIGMDMTRRRRPCGDTGLMLWRKAKQEFPHTLFLADIATEDEAKDAIEAGVDAIATTLSGYTEDTEQRLKPHQWYEYWPDFELVKRLTDQFPFSHTGTPIIAEGRYRDPEQCSLALHNYGAWAVCVGSQITRIRESTRWHAQALKGGFVKE